MFNILYIFFFEKRTVYENGKNMIKTDRPRMIIQYGWGGGDWGFACRMTKAKINTRTHGI